MIGKFRGYRWQPQPNFFIVMQLWEKLANYQIIASHLGKPGSATVCTCRQRCPIICLFHGLNHSVNRISEDVPMKYRPYVFTNLFVYLTFHRAARWAGGCRFPGRVSVLAGTLGRVRGDSVLHYHAPGCSRRLLGSHGQLPLQFRHLCLR